MLLAAWVTVTLPVHAPLTKVAVVGAMGTAVAEVTCATISTNHHFAVRVCGKAVSRNLIACSDGSRGVALDMSSR